jgi:TPR repeat protein
MTAQRLPHAVFAALFIGLLGMPPAHSYACPQQSLSEQNPQDAQAQYELGKALEKNCEKTEAVKWYSLAAEQGHAEAQLELGMAYLGFFGEKLTIDEVEAFKWITRSAEQGNVGAAIVLGASYIGKGDYAEALKWIKPHAEQGDASAQSVLGGIIYRHDAATVQDLEESRKWLLLSAGQGHAGSQLFLGEIYMQGKGVKADKVEGVKWLRLAAEQQDKAAQIGLGFAYLKGEGVEQNRETSREWFKRAFSKIADHDLEKVLDALEHEDYGIDHESLHKLEQGMRKYY